MDRPAGRVRPHSAVGGVTKRSPGSCRLSRQGEGGTLRAHELPVMMNGNPTGFLLGVSIRRPPRENIFFMFW